ncbi:hypothetical protein C2G38_2214011 [Gigaspora rosea]|uniref:MACPF domain-containing protein n=1 Tax=Gigaspora rosea TaxID=44941 RepID=A0A397UBF2_9GLOM|nr:hypothetical protein C2G38_2214011 [Gigaspora rosea]
MAWIPGIDELGSGYDYLNGQYAQSELCTENLFDWSNFPTYKREHDGHTYIVSFYLKRAVEYIAVTKYININISNSFFSPASILDFTGSLNIELGKVVDYSKFRKFSRIQYDYSSHLFHLTSSLSTFSLKMDGRVVLSASSNKLGYNSKENFKFVAKAAALEIFKGEVSQEYKEASTVQNNSVFKTFDRSKSLSFIGDLAEVETRRKQFMDAWPVYAHIHSRKFKSFNPPYLEYTYMTSTTSATQRETDNKTFTTGTMPIINPYKKSGPGGTGEVARYDTSYVMAPSFHGMIRVEGGNERSKWKWLADAYFKNNEEKYGILIREKPYAEGLLRPIVKKKCLKSELDIAPQDGTLHLSTITCSNNSSPIQESIWLLRMGFMEYFFC